MKKLFSLMLVLLMVVSMTACNGTKNDNNTQNPGHWEDKTTQEIMQEIVKNSDTQIMADVVDGKEYYRNALSLGELEFEEITLYMPMMSAQRFEVAVIRVKDGTDVAAYAADLEKRAANAEWLCAAPPDYVKVAVDGDCVLYMAINKEFADEEAMVKTFTDPAA